jgi:nucleotide-binding universal stress UspA family protein
MKDVLLHINSYPDPTPPEAIDQAVRFAAATSAGLTALAVQVDLKTSSNWLADQVVSLSAMCAEQEARSQAACQQALDHFNKSCAIHKVSGTTLLTRADLYVMGDHVAGHARTRDLCLVPWTDPADSQRSVAETVVFESGRPVLLFRAGVADLPAEGFGDVVVAWDGGRAAARALADALPLLKLARRVRVLTIVNEKAAAHAHLGSEVVRHLGAYGITAVVEEADAGGRKVGRVLTDHLAAHPADLLVMGAYGHSRFREFLLGGATAHMLHDPATPIFLSH